VKIRFIRDNPRAILLRLHNLAADRARTELQEPTMPLYEYYCADCRGKFEALRPMPKADATIQCPECESLKTSRALSMFAVHGGTSVTDSPASFAGGGCCSGGACGCSVN
jgi:putative FmdB family regulatory protein